MAKQLSKLRQNVVPNKTLPKKGDVLKVNGKSETIVAVDGKYFYTKNAQYRKSYKGIEGIEIKEEEDEPV